MQPFVLNILKPKLLTVIAIVAMICLTSCARGITPYEAANGKAKCGKYIK